MKEIISHFYFGASINY